MQVPMSLSLVIIPALFTGIPQSVFKFQITHIRVFLQNQSRCPGHYRSCHRSPGFRNIGIRAPHRIQVIAGIDPVPRHDKIRFFNTISGRPTAGILLSQFFIRPNCDHLPAVSRYRDAPFLWSFVSCRRYNYLTGIPEPFYPEQEQFIFRILLMRKSSNRNIDDPDLHFLLF